MSFSQPGRGDVHVDKPLTNISIAFMQDDDAFVAGRAFQVVPVSKQSDVYFTLPRGRFFADEMQKLAPGAKPIRLNHTVSTDSYRCDVWSAAEVIADQIRANYDAPLQADMEITRRLSLQALIRKERQFASEMFTTGVWTLDQAGVAAAPGANQFLQFDQALSNPVRTVRAWKRIVLARTGYKPNVLVLGREVYDAIVDNDLIVGRLDRGQTTGPAMVLKQNLAALFELDEILVMDGIVNTAAEGATDAFSFIGGKSALLLYRPSSPGLMTPAAGYTFGWNGLLGGGAVGGQMRRLRLDEEQADLLQMSLAFDLKKVSADLGLFASAAVA